MGAEGQHGRADVLSEVQEPVLESAAKETQGGAMKPVSDNFLKESEELATESIKAMRAFLVYQGSDPVRYHKAKIASVGLTNYVRLRATETNRVAVEQVTARQIASGASGE